MRRVYELGIFLPRSILLRYDLSKESSIASSCFCEIPLDRRIARIRCPSSILNFSLLISFFRAMSRNNKINLLAGWTLRTTILILAPQAGLPIYYRGQSAGSSSSQIQ